MPITDFFPRKYEVRMAWGNSILVVYYEYRCAVVVVTLGPARPEMVWTWSHNNVMGSTVDNHFIDTASRAGVTVTHLISYDPDFFQIATFKEISLNRRIESIDCINNFEGGNSPKSSWSVMSRNKEDT